jgi:hypothetical protein
MAPNVSFNFGASAPRKRSKPTPRRAAANARRRAAGLRPSMKGRGNQTAIMYFDRKK